jgi:hypothetical protein
VNAFNCTKKCRPVAYLLVKLFDPTAELNDVLRDL